MALPWPGQVLSPSDAKQIVSRLRPSPLSLDLWPQAKESWNLSDRYLEPQQMCFNKAFYHVLREPVLTNEDFSVG